VKLKKKKKLTGGKLRPCESRWVVVDIFVKVGIGFTRE
jgi:hypothetical protein